MKTSNQTETLVPYPRAVILARDSEMSETLSGKSFRELAKTYGREIVLVGRYDTHLQGGWVPIEIINFADCGDFLIELSKDQLTADVNFDSDARKQLDKSQLVCAPDLSGSKAFGLAAQVQKITNRFPTELRIPKSIKIVPKKGCWNLKLSKDKAIEFIHERAEASAEWWLDAKKHEIDSPHGSWSFYEEKYADLQKEEYNLKLTDAIKKYAKSRQKFVHKSLPIVSDKIVSTYQDILGACVRTNSRALAEACFRTMAGDHEALECIKMPKSFAHFKSEINNSGHKHTKAAIQRLYQEELLAIDKIAISIPLTLNENFVWTLDAAHLMSEKVFAVNPFGTKEGFSLFSPKDAHDNLDMYVGGFLDKLDLSRSFITGSGAMSAAMSTPMHDNYSSHNDYLESFFPRKYTKCVNPLKLVEFVEDTLYDINRTPNKLSFVPKTKSKSSQEPKFDIVWDKKRVIGFEETSGADVDIAVDAVGKEFDLIAQNHFKVVQATYSDAVLERTERTRSCMYTIRSKKGAFRDIEIYPATWTMICTHHLGMVRLAYTSRNGTKEPRFYLTSSAVMSALSGETPDFNYFASKKNTPQDILLKYAVRGYTPEAFPKQLSRALLKYAEKSLVWNPSGARCRTWGWCKKQGPALRCSGLYNLRNLVEECRAWVAAH